MNVSNFDQLCELSINYALENNIKKIILFSKTLRGVMKLNNILKSIDSNSNIDIIVVTFPMNQEYLIRNEEDDVTIMKIELHDKKNIKKLNSLGLKLVSSMLPFDDIITKSTDSNKNSLIDESLSLVHPALSLAIQSSLMATDCGAILPGERIISLVNGISIDTIGCNTRYLFHPIKKLIVNEIICKIKED